MNDVDIKNLIKTPTTSIGALPDTNYFDISNGYKKLLKKWKYTYFDDFDFERLFYDCGNEIVSAPYIAELHGHGFPWYTNVKYPFLYNPPFVEGKIPSMVFLRNERITIEQDKEYIIEINGICNSYYLFVNGAFAGFSNITHATKRFDITLFIKNGNNEIRLIVAKYSPSSYLEDQDKFRYSGIIRPIYLIKRSKGSLSSFVVKTKLKDKTAVVALTCDKEVVAELSGFGYSSEAKKGKAIQFEVTNPKLWNAEEPHLYDLTIYDGENIIHQNVGIRETTIKSNRIYLNGYLFKMRGVNRHSSTLNGDVESLNIFKKDIELFKKLNINAVRTSHYPADERFLDLCDKNGIYVIAESDLETHGAVTKNGGYDVDCFNDVIKRLEFKEQIIERELNNVKSNINHPCILLWSFGNESGYDTIVDEACRLIKEIDDRPIHYEGTYNYSTDNSYHESKEIDVYSRMYPSVQYCVDVPKILDKPFMLCEFVHAMGNSLGEINDYMEPFFDQDNFFGAFVWEWTNHYVLQEGLEKYGGDFNEPYHDGSFCVDGLVSLDRQLSPKTRELKESYAPIHYEYNDGKIYVTNRYDFTNLQKHKFVIQLDDKAVEIKDLKIEPHERDILLNQIDSRIANIKCYDGKGKLVSYKSLIIRDECSFPKKNDKGEISFKVDKRGMLSAISANGRTIMRNMMILLSRPLTSNDCRYLDKYKELKLNELCFKKQSIKTINSKTIVKGIICHDTTEPYFEATLTFEIVQQQLLIKVSAKKIKEDFEPLRFGLLFELEDNYGNISYFGYDGESYCDRHEANIYGIHTIDVDDNFRYIVPQAANDHFKTKYLVLNKDKVCVSADKDFSFNYDCFLEKDYLRHRNEMGIKSKRYLILDYKTRGVGTDACGPLVADKYRITEKEIEIRFCIYLMK